MASIRKREWESGGKLNSSWVVDYFDQTGKRRLKSFRTNKAAREWSVTALSQIAEGTHTPDSVSITVAGAAELWLKAAQLNKLERSTIRQYENHVRHHINPLIGRIKLSTLTTPMVEDFADKLLDRPHADNLANRLSRTMAKKIVGSLKGIIAEAIRKGKASKNPADVVRVKVPKRGTVKIRAGRDFPTKAEINLMLRSVEGRWRPVIVTAIFTGMRASELRGLRWEDIDFDARIIHVRQRADAWNTMGEPKTEAGERDIPMTPMVENVLREWELICPRVGRVVDREGNVTEAGRLWLVFPNGGGKPENHANLANRGFYALQLKAGIVEPRQEGDRKTAGDKDGIPVMKPKYGIHTLRHFFASLIIEQNFPPKKVQALLGHSSMQMTYDVYGHLFPNPDDDLAKMATAELSLVG